MSDHEIWTNLLVLPAPQRGIALSLIATLEGFVVYCSCELIISGAHGGARSRAHIESETPSLLRWERAIAISDSEARAEHGRSHSAMTLSLSANEWQPEWTVTETADRHVTLWLRLYAIQTHHGFKQHLRLRVVIQIVGHSSFRGPQSDSRQ